MVEDFDKYMALAKVLNTTWGTGSQLRMQSQSIKFNLRDDKLLKGTVTMIVNMPNSPQTAVEYKRRYKEESLNKIGAAIKNLAELYEEATGKKIKLKLIETSITEGLEYISNSQYRPNLPAYFRLQCLFSIE